MSQNSELGKLAQYLLVNTSSNTISFTSNASSVSVGNTSVTIAPVFTVANASSNLVITSSSISIGGITVVNSLSVPSPGVNVAAQYAWTNTQTFSNTITFSSLLNVGSNVVVNTSALFVGNSTVNAYYNQTGFIVANSTVTVNVGSLGIYVGANAFINTTAFFIGTSTVNSYITTAGFVVSNSTTTSVANTTGHYTGTINSSSIGFSVTNNALIIGNTSTQANITATTLAIGNTSNAWLFANTTKLTTPYFTSDSIYAFYAGAGTVYLTLAGNIYGSGQVKGGTSLAVGQTTQTTWISGSLSLNSSSTANTDIDISSYLLASSASQNFIRVKVQGQYIANNNASQNTSGGATLNQSHLWKSWEQMAWANVAAVYALEGGTVTASYNGDATNFPAGAINAAKALLVSNTTSIYLRLINRTTPAAASVTYYSYLLEITSF